MLVRSYRVKLRPLHSEAKVANGQPVAQFPGGPPVGVVTEFDEETSEGIVRLHTPRHYSELEDMGIRWCDFIDCE